MERIINILVGFIALITVNSYGQLKVAPNGAVGIGFNNPGTEFKLHVQGGLLLSNYPVSGYSELRFELDGGPKIGANSGVISMWSDGTGFNSVFASNFFTVSDINLKSNVTEINLGLQKLMKIRPVYYSMINRTVDSIGQKIEGKIEQYGFISQEIEKALPEVKITYDSDGYKLMDYDQIIPIAVAAIQEQQLVIDSLKNDVESLKKIILKNNVDFSISNESNGNTLFQNYPNPFKERTKIEYLVDNNNFREASLLIFDMNGLLLKQIAIHSAGKGEIIIEENELSAGMYIYSLIVNQKEVDSKRMILLN